MEERRGAESGKLGYPSEYPSLYRGDLPAGRTDLCPGFLPHPKPSVPPRPPTAPTTISAGSFVTPEAKTKAKQSEMSLGLLVATPVRGE